MGEVFGPLCDVIKSCFYEMVFSLKSGQEVKKNKVS